MSSRFVRDRFVVNDGGVSIDPLRLLVDAAHEGDNRALGEFVRQTQADVWRVCAALGTRGDEEDLVQEVYARVVRSLGTYRGDAPVRAWLMAIARNVCADDIRRRQRQRRVLERLRVVERDDHLDPSVPVDDLLTGISDERREAFVLTQLAGLSYEEAALALDCPIGTVRSRVARARADLLDVVRRTEAI